VVAKIGLAWRSVGTAGRRAAANDGINVGRVVAESSETPNNSASGISTLADARKAVPRLVVVR
jgi:hypothetical protein